MDVLRCEVIGCCRSAAWTRASDFKSLGEDLLCGECWRSLRSLSRAKAARYELLTIAQRVTFEPAVGKEKLIRIE